MQNTIYLDVLILINIFITYCLLYSTKTILNLQAKKWRIILASVLGGAFSLIILFDFSSTLLLNVVKLSMAISLVLLSFFEQRISRNLRNIAVFYLVNFIYGGLMFALYYFVTPASMVYKNGVVYFNVSAIFLAFSTTISYLLIKLFYAFFATRGHSTEECLLTVSVDGKAVLLRGFSDNGNKLVDVISSLPVVICSFESIKQIIPEKLHENILSLNFEKIDDPLWQKRLRVISTATVNKVSVMPAFLPDSCILETSKNKPREIKVLFSLMSDKIMDAQYDAIINSSIIN